MNRATQAIQYHDSGFNCAQSVLTAFAEDLGLSPALALRLASTFGGGMRMAATCGALTGALMALGLAHGFSRPDPPDKQRIESLTRELIQRWRKEIGPTDCKDILGYDVSDPIQKEAAKKAGVFDAHCHVCIAKATDILCSMLAEFA